MNRQPKTEQADEDVAQLTATAYHEAGHAVVAVSLGRTIHKVTINAANLQFGGIRLGAVKFDKGRAKASKDAVEDEVLILFAGMVAEARFTGKYCPAGAQEDLVSVRRLLGNRAGNERQFERLERRLLKKTEHLLHDEAHVAAIESIAVELLEKRTISGRTVRHFFQQAQQQFS